MTDPRMRQCVAGAMVFLCLAATGALMFATTPVMAGTELPPGYLAGGILTGPADDPDAALAELDAVLDDLSNTGEPDPRIVFDITRQQVDILIAAGRAEEAGDLLIALADYTAGNRAVLGRGPGALLSEAADLLIGAGAYGPAREALEALLGEQRDGGLPGPALAATHERLAVLEAARGDDAAAAGERAVAAELADPEAPASRGAGEDHVAVDVFYATDRARTASPEPAQVYRAGRAPGLDYGIATVTIPRSHRPGAIETPSIWRAEFGLSPARHIMLQSVRPMEETTFFGDLHSAVVARSRKEIFVFVHGYNTSFEQAAKRAAQLAYDMHYAGLPVLYSWPSQGRVAGYVADEAVVRLSGRRLSRFLEDLAARTGAENINIVAHSMGNRALTDALELLALRRGAGAGDPPMFDQVVFAAPDVDAGLFAEMVPVMRPLARRLTLYASEADWALFASRRLHGDAPRAGQGGKDLMLRDDIDSIDMTLLGEDMLSHSYFSSALLDLATLFRLNLDPPQRCGLTPAEEVGQKIAWRYHPEACEASVLLDLMAVVSVSPDLDPHGIETLVRRAIADPAAAQAVVNEALQLLFR